MRRTLRRIGGAGLVLGLALALAACGGSEEVAGGNFDFADFLGALMEAGPLDTGEPVCLDGVTFIETADPSEFVALTGCPAR